MSNIVLGHLCVLRVAGLQIFSAAGEVVGFEPQQKERVAALESAADAALKLTARESTQGRDKLLATYSASLFPNAPQAE